MTPSLRHPAIDAALSTAATLLGMEVVFIGGLSARALVRVEINGTTAREAQRLNLNQRIREVEQGPDGAIWVLEDQQSGSGGRLLRLTP